MLKNVELLAPAGTYEAFIAAVENGANAIYMGGKLFNARANASNFDIDELQKIVQYAHLRNVKIHITMNTLLDDSEIEDKLFNNQNLLKQPVVRNGKTLATVGLSPKIWETWS